MAPEIRIFLTGSLILCLSLKFLCLDSKLIQIIIFIFNTLRECSMRIQNNPRVSQRESYWLTQREANPIGCLPLWHIFVARGTSRRRQVLLMGIQNVSEIAQCLFKIWQELLYFII